MNQMNLSTTSIKIFLSNCKLFKCTEVKTKKNNYIYPVFSTVHSLR